MTIHSDYWWYVQEILFCTDMYVYFAKKAEENMRNGLIVPKAHEIAAQYAQKLSQCVGKLSTPDWFIVHDLIAEAMS